MLISFAMICSCQKQGSAVERQLAQRKVELDAREKALDEREKALDEREREKVLAEWDKATPNVPKPPAPVQGQIQDPSQLKAEQLKAEQLKAEIGGKIEQLPAEVQAMIPDPAKVKAERDARMQERRAEAQRMLEQFQRKSSEAAQKNEVHHSTPRPKSIEGASKNAMSGLTPAAVFPSAEAPSLAASPPPAYTAAPAAVYPGAEATSPSPSPTPQ